MANYVHTDGGRAAAGYKGKAGDCFARALSIATGCGYKAAVDIINTAAKEERTKRGRLGMLAATGRGSSAMSGVYVDTAHRVMEMLGWKWTATMKPGTGCKVHLRGDELPSGRIIARVSKHYVAVIDGVVYDDHDSTRDGKRCVYGYWHKP